MMTRPFFNGSAPSDHDLPNAKVCDQRDDAGLTGQPGRRKAVVGDQLRQARVAAAPWIERRFSEEIRAELVIDPTAGATATPLVSGLGLSSPPETKIRVDVAYSTRFIVRRPSTPPPYVRSHRGDAAAS